VPVAVALELEPVPVPVVPELAAVLVWHRLP
jgi:hypothetical protein